MSRADGDNHGSGSSGDGLDKLTGDYVLPSHEDEVRRLQHQHFLFYQTFSGRRYLSPLVSPTRILDLGCGTGDWAVEMADEFPQATVTGVDLGVIPIASHAPRSSNFRSLVANFEDDWASFCEKDDPYDFIHGRLIVMSMRDHRRLIQKSYQYLRPGGWFEIQDIDVGPNTIGEQGELSADESVQNSRSTDHIMEWVKLENEGFVNLGIDGTALIHWPAWLLAAGFSDVHHRLYVWPLGEWPEHQDFKELGKLSLDNFLNGVEGWSMTVITRGLGWSSEKVHEFLQKVRSDLMNTKRRYYLTIHVIYAQKPMAG